MKRLFLTSLLFVSMAGSGKSLEDAVSDYCELYNPKTWGDAENIPDI